ncbi:Tryptophan synthase alpha chain [Jeotgalicoccus saudimassiliensis]|uniref:Tryptophan synthase alpha chain n=1 Tax=Jeotgalicoccus saudimassiliensis TaxID=1461582 RepID=A0A078M340_9STAP|nr:tryptophan synthase subunit alpha [Jeotgalicoccus saudimassiliensis]CDZ99166.1 Tryptophan synthase alpha chain [Jeotgalicoccus saudimassiliensis]
MTKAHINDMFNKLNETDDKAFIAYMMAGDGGLDKLPEQIKTLEKAGVDLIEIGIPFSDPAADGPVIQEAGIRALKENVSLRDILDKLTEIKDDINVPYVLMTYYNPVFSYGLEAFAQDAQAANVSGLIVPDVPLDEEPELKNALTDTELAIIRLATLTTTDERLEQLVDEAEGFIYAVTVNGVTGKQAGYSEEVYDNLARIKEKSAVPVCAGFGITSSEAAEALGEHCDGVIVGSAIVEMLNRNEEENIKNLIPKKHAARAK